MDKLVRKQVLNTAKYVAGKPINEVKRELGVEEVIKLASNENPLGCSQKVKEAIKTLADNIALYPDSGNFELKTAIGEKFNVPKEKIFCGAGSDSLIMEICNTFLNEGEESIMAEVTFPRYEAGTKLMGAECVKIPMKDHGLDIEKMVDAITDKTKIIWFCNPNNPTGTITTKEEFMKVLDRIPNRVIIVMDEAYVEYVENKDFPNSLELLQKYPNMIVLRTFSKGYGLAALRCGYGIANEEIVQYVSRIINPFDVNLYAQVAAVAAIKDDEFLKRTLDMNREGKEYLYKEFKDMGFDYIESHTNFIMVNLNRDDKPISDGLLKKGIIIRSGYLLGMPNWLRISIGTMEQNKKLIQAMKELI